MTRRTMPLAFAVMFSAGLAACEASEIAIFSADQAGAAGAVGVAGAAGTAGIVGAVGVAGTAGTAGTAGAAGMGGSGMGGSGMGGSGMGGSNCAASAGQSSGGAAAVIDTPCQTTAECQPAWFCKKQSCADPQGVCLPRPSIDDSSLHEVCGCDHLTYWNDTLRQQYGECASTPGECTSGARACTLDADCGPAATCSHWLPSMSSCSTPGSGRCWVLPTDCPSPGDKPHFQLCPVPGSPSGGPPSPCVTTCQAVQSGQPYFPAPRGSCP